MSGGAAVYRARGMYQSATGFVFFDDADLCQQQNINWRKAEVKPNKTDNISVYPNPANDVLNIHFTDKHQKSSIVIYNSMGQKISENTLPTNSTNYQMSVKYFASGIYFVKIGDFVQKFVIQH